MPKSDERIALAESFLDDEAFMEKFTRAPAGVKNHVGLPDAGEKVAAFRGAALEARAKISAAPAVSTRGVNKERMGASVGRGGSPILEVAISWLGTTWRGP